MAKQRSETRTSRSRRRLLIVIFALIILFSVAGWWFLWVPNWRPSLNVGESYGIDVSSHQEEIDWDAVAGDGIEFAYIKATEGGDFVDDRFQENWQAAQEARLERGAYHFFTLCTKGKNQAENFLQIVPPDETALAPAVDLELAGNCSERPPRVDVHYELEQFLQAVETAWGRDTVLYLGNDFESLYEVRKEFDRPLWLRRFLLRPATSDWLIWQLHGYAQVGGIQGRVDLDVMRTK